MSVRIVCVGSLNQDITVWVSRPPGPDETLAAHRMETFLGGKGANQAVAASRLGAHVAMVGRVGSDIAGGSIVAALETEGVDHRHVEGGEGHTGTAIPIVTDDGQVSIIVVAGANALLRPDDVDRAADVIATADLLLVQGEVSVESSLRAAQLARRAGAQVLVNPAPVLPGVGALLDAATVIVANAQEADALDLVADGQVVITHGAAGAVVGGIHVPAHPVEVVDPTGAGDAYCAALGVILAEGAPLLDAARFAAAAGALAVQRAGAQPSMPRRAEVEALCRSQSRLGLRQRC